MEDSVCGGVQSDCKCGLCNKKRGRSGQYCAECRKDVEACWKDAEKNSWMDDFKNMQEHGDTFKALMKEYRLDCPKPGRGKKRAQFSTDRLPTRLREGQPLDSRPRSPAEVSH